MLSGIFSGFNALLSFFLLWLKPVFTICLNKTSFPSNLALLEEYTIRCRNAGYKIILIADEVHVMNSFSSNMSKKLRALRPNFACVV